MCLAWEGYGYILSLGEHMLRTRHVVTQLWMLKQSSSSLARI